jgi:hypothetical protein
MAQAARRLALRARIATARRALLALCVLLTPVTALAQADQPAAGQQLVSARYLEPTQRYPHAVLGDDIEYGALALRYANGARIVIRLPEARVFEDTAPRIVDVDGDGQAEAVAVESHQSEGARLAIYNAAGLVAATPYIGQRFRWLAPVAIADLDGDGLVELAYIDRPHLAKTLRVWRFEDGQMTQIASLGGLTNHRIGERDIAGGMRDCGKGPEMILASSDWHDLVAVTFNGSALECP